VSSIPKYPTLKNISPKDLAMNLINEHPQVITVALSILDFGQRGQVLRRLPEGLATEVLLRLCNLDFVEQYLVDRVASALENQIIKADDFYQLGGVQPVAETLNNLDKNTVTALMSRLEERDPVLVEEVRKLMFVFEDLERAELSGLKVVLREVPTSALVLALKTASEKLREKLLAVYTIEERQDIFTQIEQLGPQRLVDVESAQQEIVGIAKRLEAEGKIRVARGGSEDALV
jgi:flagellar motor switch protein FliG